MLASAHFSHKQLMNKSNSDKHEMLHHIGINWTTDTTPRQRNGTFIFPAADGGLIANTDILPQYAHISNYLEDLITENIEN